MLILVAGITGFVGLPYAKAALARGHKVRGLARNADKVPKDTRDQLEGFETLPHIYDINAMKRAIKGVDAVICAFAGIQRQKHSTSMVFPDGLKLCQALDPIAMSILRENVNIDIDVATWCNDLQQFLNSRDHPDRFTPSQRVPILLNETIIVSSFLDS